MGGAERLLIDRLDAEVRVSPLTDKPIVFNVAPEHNVLENELARTGLTICRPKGRGRLRPVIAMIVFLVSLSRGTIVVSHSPAPSTALKLLRLLRIGRFRLVQVVHNTRFHPAYRPVSWLLNHGSDFTVAVSEDVRSSWVVAGSKRVAVVHGGVQRAAMVQWLGWSRAMRTESETSWD